MSQEKNTNCVIIFTESLLELIIAKDSLKSNSPSIQQILMHPFFKEFAPSFDQIYADCLTPSKLSFPETAKDSIIKASQKTEQRLKDEQKLVIFLSIINNELFTQVYLLRSKVKNVLFVCTDQKKRRRNKTNKR